MPEIVLLVIERLALSFATKRPPPPAVVVLPVCPAEFPLMVLLDIVKVQAQAMPPPLLVVLLALLLEMLLLISVRDGLTVSASCLFTAMPPPELPVVLFVMVTFVNVRLVLPELLTTSTPIPAPALVNPVPKLPR